MIYRKIIRYDAHRFENWQNVSQQRTGTLKQKEFLNFRTEKQYESRQNL